MNMHTFAQRLLKVGLPVVCVGKDAAVRLGGSRVLARVWRAANMTTAAGFALMKKRSIASMCSSNA